jgi:carboxypeptidase Taq
LEGAFVAAFDEKYNRLKSRLAEVLDLRFVQSVLDWDAQVNMPPGGAEDRGAQMETVARLAHEKFVDPEIGRLLEDLQSDSADLDPDSDESRMLQVAARDYEKTTRVSAEWVAEFARVRSVAQSMWAEARANSDFARFQPHLQRLVELRRQFSEFFAPYDHVYDPQLDAFERGMKTAEVQQIFNSLRPQQVSLIKAIGDHPQVDDSFLRKEYSEDDQWNFGVGVITKLGYDWKRGRQDRSAHPFTTTFGLGDVRITTRFLADRMESALFGSIHEAGHALYEQGIAPALARTPLQDGASMAIHESQSRMFENLVGRSLPFWSHFYPTLQKSFPAQLDGVSLEQFYRGINKVEPSLIRVEADEATYNLHIMLRLELEIALLEGSLQVADLPAAWNERFEAYLGLTPPNDAQGVLQDIHWSAGLFGYFPTYALGNLVSVQMWETLQRDLPDLDDQIARGEFADLLGWLRENVHQYGAKYEPQELVQRVTGSKIDPAPYLRYLNQKFGEIYGL